MKTKEELKRLSKNELVRIAMQSERFTLDFESLVKDYTDMIQSETHIRALAFRLGYYAGLSHLALELGLISRPQFQLVKKETVELAEEQANRIRKRKGRKLKNEKEK